MLLTLTATPSPSMPDATDLGFLLHKHPDKAQQLETSSGTAHVFWPEASDERATVALLLEVDPIALVRGRASLTQHVNDRPYAASSLLAVALAKVFRTAMNGRCDARPDLVGRALQLKVQVSTLPGSVDLIERLFAPLGWTVTACPLPLDETVPGWGDAPYCSVTLTGDVVLAEALTHLYVLIPVLDGSKHYWVGSDEVDKLLRAGGAWLAGHPERDLITRRYLAHARELVDDATVRLAELDGAPAPEPAREERRTPLAVLRTDAVLAALQAAHVRTVVDLGCGEGALLRKLVRDPSFTRVVGVDVSHRALHTATRRLGLDRLSDTQRERVELWQSSVTYRDDRLTGFDAAVLMEVIEHVDLPRLPALERSVFGRVRPATVLVTTPNVEHNVRYEHLPAGTLRHRDHRFEWTRAEFRSWAAGVGQAHGYAVRHLPVGADDPEVGPPTQLAVFTWQEVPA